MKILEINKHLPYIESDLFRKEVSDKQRIKGSQKYPELFTPSSWTDDELAEHAMMEFHDGQEYVSGMRIRMREMRKEIERLEIENKILQQRLEDES